MTIDELRLLRANTAAIALGGLLANHGAYNQNGGVGENLSGLTYYEAAAMAVKYTDALLSTLIETEPNFS